MILHTVNKSPFSDNCLTDCLSFCRDSDSVLLLEDGVYGAQSNTKSIQLIEQNSNINYYVLEADVKARGLLEKIHNTITIINDEEFVSLAIKHNSVQSWF